MEAGSFIDDLRDIPSLNKFNSGTATGLVIAREGPVDSLQDDEPAPARQVETFPCESCGGTGRYRGVRLHQPATECFACKGRGYFKKSYKDRMAARQKSAARKVAQAEKAAADFDAAYPGLRADLTALATWNNFAGNLLLSLGQFGSLTENQINAARNQIEKAAARDAARKVEAQQRVANAPVVETDKLKAALDLAGANGLKKPKLRFEGFSVSVAPLTGKNAGALYLKSEGGEYLGKIMGGKLFATREAEAVPNLMQTITAAMVDPVATARAYGKRTGNCSCCGRELSDPVSVEMGIGPICAGKFGF